MVGVLKGKSNKILQAVLTEVPFDGWTDSAYERGLKKAEVARGEADLLFPQGVRDLIELFGETADQAMLAKIKAEPGFQRFRVRDKIMFAVKARLEFLTPHREAVRRMMIWYALLPHLVLGLKRLSKTVDLIWVEAGDVYTDFNYYTKRVLLAGIVKATMVVWLDDETSGCQASWDFLERRISEVLKFGKTISLIKEWTPREWIDKVRSTIKRAS